MRWFILALSLLATFWLKAWTEQRTRKSNLAQCKSNVRNIGTALEMYSTDNSGRYPLSLDLLVPSYLKSLPTCPTVGHETYRSGYQSVSIPDNYTVSCQSGHHRRSD